MNKSSAACERLTKQPSAQGIGHRFGDFHVHEPADQAMVEGIRRSRRPASRGICTSLYIKVHDTVVLRAPA
jgi:hypothetical protein